MAGQQSATHNQTRTAFVEEVTWGVTPVNPEFQTLRVTAPDMNVDVTFNESKEIRDDRMMSDQTPTSASGAGTFGFELSAGSFDKIVAGACMANWVTTPEIVNVTADSNITQVTDSTDTFTVASGGAAFKAGHLVRSTGFGSAANNTIGKVQSSTATSVVIAGTPALADEAAPPAGAKLKVIGFEGASGDITATSTGLASTALDFTTLGLAVGQWVYPGGSGGASNKFATAANNGWCRISAIAANAITFDVKPAGWSVDAGTGKSVRVLMTEYVRNGKVDKSFTFQRTFGDTTVPEYQNQPGSMVSTFSLDVSQGADVTGQFAIMSKDSDIVETNFSGATYTAANTNAVMSAQANVFNVVKDGVASTAYYTKLAFSLDNKIRVLNKIAGGLNASGMKNGTLNITFNTEEYFLEGSGVAALKANTGCNYSVGFNDAAGNTIILDLPNVKRNSYKINAGSLDADALVSISYKAFASHTISAAVQFSRLP